MTYMGDDRRAIEASAQRTLVARLTNKLTLTQRELYEGKVLAFSKDTERLIDSADTSEELAKKMWKNHYSEWHTLHLS